METITVRIEGTSPLLMHNGQLADPMCKATKILKDAVKDSKQKKTDAAYEKTVKAEFMGGLYLDEGEPCLTAEMLEAMICSGAKKSKQGMDVKSAVIIDSNFPLLYEGPRDPEKLWKNGSYRKTTGVRVGKNRIMRTRPMFSGWACEFSVNYNPTVINKDDLLKFISVAGSEVGIGDFRPRYGRFELVK